VVLSHLAARTSRIKLFTAVTTLSLLDPVRAYEDYATLDHLSDGRSAWNMVTSSDAFTGENFRRGGFLAHADRYHRAEEFITVAPKGPSNASKAWLAVELLLLVALLAPLKSVAGETARTLLPLAWVP